MRTKNPNAPFSPLAVMMLMHFYAIAEPFDTRGGTSQDAIIEYFLANDLIEPAAWGYRTTESGRVLVAGIKTFYVKALGVM